jgi:hypothetical protein
MLFGLTMTYARLKFLVTDVSLGGLGLFIVFAYAAGHLTQAFGNVVEDIWWKAWGGKPSDWVRNEDQTLLAASQRSALAAQIQKQFQTTVDLDKISSSDWYSLTRQIYATVQGKGRSSRIDTFNGSYGLNRGMAGAFALLAILTLIHNYTDWKCPAALACLAMLSAYRMHRFGQGYARELFVEFLRLP